MAQHNPVNMALRFQCRLDARRRFLKPESCRKAPLRNMCGEIIKECQACPGPIELIPENKGNAIMNETQTPITAAAEISGDRLMSAAEVSESKNREEPAPNPESEPAPKIDVKMCKKCGVNPAAIRKDGISLGICLKCKSECMEAARVAKAANKTASPLSTSVKAEQPAPVEKPSTASTAPAALPKSLMNLLRDIDTCWYFAKVERKPLEPALAEVLVTGSMLFNSYNESQAK